MALKGNCTHTEYVESGETEIISITNPDGTEEEREQPIMNSVETEYNDVYVIVKQVEFFQTYVRFEEEVPNNTTKLQAVLFQIAGYESKEARDADQENYLFWNPMQLHDYDYNLNLLEQCYNLVRQTEGFTNLIND